ncbi:MAG: hypothetical protein IME93_03005 [Proteobacteria bacterium]|nr:hypothetical protein [Pseudomonadota bacterium]
MFKLGNGIFISISSERARFHAVRQNMRVSSHTPHHQLHKLVDILISNSEADPGKCHSQYRFSGCTITDHHFFNDMHDEDRQRFYAWLEHDEQKREIEGARKLLAYDNVPHKVMIHDYPKNLYSGLRKRLQALRLSRASIDQWQATINNMVSKGISSDEITWSGIHDYLDSARLSGKQVLEKHELLSNLDVAPTKPCLTNELVVDGSPVLEFRSVASRCSAWLLNQFNRKDIKFKYALIRYVDERLGYRVGLVRLSNKAVYADAASMWFVMGPYGEMLEVPGKGKSILFDRKEEALRYANEHAEKVCGGHSRLIFNNKYEYVSLDGGKDYREWLLCLPDYHRSHFIAHYTERNIVLHYRTKLRHDHQGRSLLFVEEIQSDWHQAARNRHRKNRWDRDIPDAPFKNDWISLALKLMLFHVIRQGYDGIAWTPGIVQQQRYQKDLAALQRVYDHEIPRALERMGRLWGVVPTQGNIATRSSELRAEHANNRWYAVDREGRHVTRPRFTKEQITRFIRQSSKAVDLDVPVFIIPQAMRDAIMQNGLPLYGEQFQATRR